MARTPPSTSTERSRTDVIVAIAGAHGKIALRLTRQLSADGDSVIGLIRNPEQATDVSDRGGSPVVCDLERASDEQIATAIKGADAAVFAAGAGGGASAARTLTVDRDGAIKLLRAAASAGVPRYLIISAGGAEDRPNSDDDLSIYLRAKADADAAVQSSDLEWTILRPGALTDDPGTGRVRVDPTPGRGTVPRDDVAAALARLLHDERAAHRVLCVNGGDQPLDQALEAVLSG
jgi:nucleoside-diphosphate-sugar epimerase